MENKIFKNGEWICPECFVNEEPLNVLFKEHDKLDIELPDNLKNMHFLVKSSFEYNGGQAKIRITADDYYKLYMNGNFVGMGPSQGYYFNYYWNEYDITPFLKNGKNDIFVDVYYQGLINRAYNSGDRRMGMVAEVFCGESFIAATDSDWEYTLSEAYTISHTFGYDTNFAENYDSRYHLSNWQKCFVKKPDYTFDENPVTPVAVYEKQPLSTEKLPDGGIFYDFGEEITAMPKLTAFGKAGDTVRILCGEETNDNPYKVRFDMRCNCLYDETWTLDEGENSVVQYEYKAFRYMAVIPSGHAEIKDVSAVVRHYPFNDNYCTLKTDSKVLSDIFQICKNGVKYGSQEVFVDCPTREKGQYAGDMTVTSGSHVILTGDTSLLKKAIDNQMQSALICNGLMAITPGSLMSEIADYSLQFPILALRYYHYSGDKEYLKKNLEVCEGIISYFRQYERADGLLVDVTEKWNLVDWPDNLRDGYDFPLDNPLIKGMGCHNVINAFYIGCVLQTEEIKGILGIGCTKRSTALIKAFDHAFYHEKVGLYSDSEISNHFAIQSNILPLFYGFCRAESKAAIRDLIVNKGLCCGVYMAYFALKALCKAGRYDDAYNLIVSTGEHSWYNMVREGATTCFEAWGKDQKWNTSLCHPWASGPISVLVEDILPNMPYVGCAVFQK